MKVKITKLPNKAYGGQQAGGALNVTPAAWGGSKAEAKEGREVKQTLTRVPRSVANLEAEGGETAFGPISGDTIPDHFKISGPRHTNGGVPLNLPDDTFIFSDTKAMRITDPAILKMFGKKPKKGGYTPAELAKPYDINKYKAILMDPNSDEKARETATLMIKNFILKLGALALAQESKKGFPQGIPEMARPYMEANGITDEDLIGEQQPNQQEGMMRNGGISKFDNGGPVNLKQLNRITIDGSLGEGQARILKDGKPITAQSGFIKVKGVQAKGDTIEIITNMGDQPLGEFQKQNDGSYKFVPNQAIYKRFEKESTADDKAIFSNFVKAIETNDNFRSDVQGAITGTNTYEPKTKSKEYFSTSDAAPVVTPTPAPTPSPSPAPVTPTEQEDVTTTGSTETNNTETDTDVNTSTTPNTTTDIGSNSNTQQNTQTQTTIPGISQEQIDFIRSLPPDQQKMVLETMMSGNENVGPGQAMLLNSMFSQNATSPGRNFRNYYVDYPFYNDFNSGRAGLPFSNPFSNRAFRKTFNWLSPVGPAMMSRPGVQGSFPVMGFPTQMTPTKVDQDIIVNPWLKSLLNRDVNRRELRTRYYFGDDLSKFTDAEEVQEIDKKSNAEFAREQFPEDDKYGRKNRRELEKILNDGSLSQEEWLSTQAPKEDEVTGVDPFANGNETPPATTPTSSLSDKEIRQRMEGPIGYIDSEGNISEIETPNYFPYDESAFTWDRSRKPEDFEPYAWQLSQGYSKESMDNIFEDILDLETEPDKMAELMAIDGITEEDLEIYRQKGPKAALENRNARIAETPEQTISVSEDDVNKAREAGVELIDTEGLTGSELENAEFENRTRTADWLKSQGSKESVSNPNVVVNENIAYIDNEGNITEYDPNYDYSSGNVIVAKKKYEGDGYTLDTSSYMTDEPWRMEQTMARGDYLGSDYDATDKKRYIYKSALDNPFEDILLARNNKDKKELMAIDGITDEDLRIYKMKGPDAAMANRNERVKFNQDVESGMYKEAMEALPAGSSPSEIIEWQSDYNSEQRLNQKRFGGAYSGLNKFLLGGYDPSLALRDGTIAGATKQEREKNYFDDMIFNEDNLDNISRDQLNARIEELLANDPVSQQEFTPPPPPTPEEDKDDSFMLEVRQKIEQAKKGNLEDVRQQGAKLTTIGIGVGNTIQDAKEETSRNALRFKKQEEANTSQGLFKGTDYALTDGQVATDSQSPADLMRTLGTTMGQYGGSTPIAMYGASMGGSYYPSFGYGGPKRVRVKKLPGFVGGGAPDPTDPTPYYSMTGAEDQAAEKGYKLKYRPDAYRYKNIGSGVGYQTSGGGWSVDDVTGLYYNEDKGQVNPGMAGLESIGTDWEGAVTNPFSGYTSTSDPSKTGFEGWKTDYLAGDKGKASDATRWYVENINKVYTDAGLDPVIDVTKGGYDIFGTELFNVPALYLDEEPEPEPEPVVEDETPEPTPEPEPEPTPEPQKIINNEGKEMCSCYDAQGNLISQTPAPEDGSDCPPCKAKVVGKKKQQDDPYEKPRFSRQMGRNLLAAARAQVGPNRVNAPQVTGQEAIPTLKNPYTADITSQLNAARRATGAYAGSSQEAFAKNLAGLAKGVTATGGRFDKTASDNVNTINKFSAINPQLALRLGLGNAQQLAIANRLNQQDAINVMKGKNARLANMNLVEQAANKSMVDKAMYNYFNPNNQISYADDMPWFRRTFRDPNLDPSVALANNTTTNTTKTKNNTTGANANKTSTSRYGGSVSSNTFIPRYNTMPYGN